MAEKEQQRWVVITPNIITVDGKSKACGARISPYHVSRCCPHINRTDGHTYAKVIKLDRLALTHILENLSICKHCSDVNRIQASGPTRRIQLMNLVDKMAEPDFETLLQVAQSIAALHPKKAR